MRKPLIAGNWKMNKTASEAEELIKEIQKGDLDPETEALCCVPFTSIDRVSGLLDGRIGLGAQNVYFEDSGAYTGEVSPLMLKDLNVEYVILGHSERREYFKETDQDINKKIRACLDHGLKVILCCGETLEEREAGKEKDKVKGQIERDLEGFDKNDMEKIVIAYEPIWAIGTGKTASSDDANEMLSYIRSLICSLYSQDVADEVRLLYGGSVKPNNIKELMEREDIDGALVGGASLKAQDFLALVNYR